MSDNDEIAQQLERLADQQQKTADMLESLVYLEVVDDSSEVSFHDIHGYWKVEPPWQD